MIRSPILFLLSLILPVLCHTPAEFGFQDTGNGEYARQFEVGKGAKQTRYEVRMRINNNGEANFRYLYEDPENSEKPIGKEVVKVVSVFPWKREEWILLDGTKATAVPKTGWLVPKPPAGGPKLTRTQRISEGSMAVDAVEEHKEKEKWTKALPAEKKSLSTVFGELISILFRELLKKLKALKEKVAQY